MSDRYTLRAELLREAEKISTGDRNKSYGEPDDHFQHVAKIANALGFRIDTGDGMIRELRGSDHTLYMLAVKLSRLLVGDMQHRDSWVDIAGYAGCGYETAELEQARRDAARALAVSEEAPYRGGSDEVKSAAQLAVSGNPSALEAMGWILTGVQDVDVCGATCSTTKHTFYTACQYRIRKRRKYV